MQIGIVMSHLHYAIGGVLLPMMIANRLGTSFIALYFFISGYGLTTSLLASTYHKEAFTNFLPHRLCKLIRPLLFISVVALICIPSLHLPSFCDMISLGVTVIPNAWFVFVLAFLYFSFWLSFRFAPPSRNSLGFIILLIMSLLSMIGPYILEYERAWWVTTLGFWTGCVYARWEEDIYAVISKWWGLTIALTSVAVIIKTEIVELLPLAYIAIPLVIVRILNLSRYTTWIDNSMAISWMPLWIDRMLRSALAFLSKVSYELYLIHGVMIIALYGLFADPLVYSLAVITSSISIAYITHKLLGLLPSNCHLFFSSHKKQGVIS